MIKWFISYVTVTIEQIHEQLNLHRNTLMVFTSTISNASVCVHNQSSILWICIYLKYPQTCINNIQCKESFHLKLKEAKNDHIFSLLLS